jgi:hypothetical protein
MSSLLQKLTECAQQQEHEIAFLRATVERLRKERDELVAQVKFAADTANRETLNAAKLRSELLSRTSVAKDKLDFCCSFDHGETTAVLPTPRIAGRRRVREDETERTLPTQ